MLRAARAGSDTALGELLQSYRSFPANIIDDEIASDLKVKASASDLVQDSFPEARRDFKKVAGSTQVEFRSWLTRILLNNLANVVRSYRQTARRDISRELPEGTVGRDEIRALMDSSATTPTEMMEQQELRSQIADAMERLPLHYQEVIRLRNYDRESFERIGRRLNRSAEAARKVWVRALECLLVELEASYGNSGGS